MIEQAILEHNASGHYGALTDREHEMNSADQSQDDYDQLLALEDLETLHEELEELGLTGLEGSKPIPDELRARMNAVGLRDIHAIHARIMQLHAELDDDESELTISDS